MNAQVNLKALVEKCMSDLIASNSLGLVEISDSEVVLKSSGFVIDIVADREGVSMVYFDKSVRPVKGYNISLFLINKRRNLLAFATSKQQANSYGEFIETEISSLAQHLRNGGQDLLAGSKEWIKSYSWPAIGPSGGIASLI